MLTFTSNGSCGAITGAKQPTIKNNKTTIPPAKASLFLNRFNTCKIKQSLSIF